MWLGLLDKTAFVFQYKKIRHGSLVTSYTLLTTCECCALQWFSTKTLSTPNQNNMSYQRRFTSYDQLQNSRSCSVTTHMHASVLHPIFVLLGGSGVRSSPVICVCPCGLKELATALRVGRGPWVGTLTLILSSSLRRSEKRPVLGGSSSFWRCPVATHKDSVL